MYRPKIVIRDIHRYGDDLTVPEAIVRLCGGEPITSYLLGAPPLSGALDLAGCFGVSLAAGRVLAAVEAAFFKAGDESLLAEARRIARDRAAQHPARAARTARNEPRAGKRPDTATLIGKLDKRSRLP